MDAREERGLVIAAKCRIVRDGNRYTVPSAKLDGSTYTVFAGKGKEGCTCPDYTECQQERQQKCKHMWAVSYFRQRERHADGSETVTERLTVTETFERKATYPQNWRAYGVAQSNEKDRFQELLFDLCRGIPEPDHSGRGRKPHSLRDSIFAMTFKVYSTLSARRFSSDLREAHRRGFLSREIPGLKVAVLMEDEKFAPILKQCIAASALPLRAVETAFAIDSSGFGSCRTETWFDTKYNTPRRKAVWVKAHLACGVKTNIVSAVRVLDKNSADSPEFAPLIKETASGGFTISEVSADKAYGSLANFVAVADCGGQFYPAFKSNATGGVGGHFEKAFHYFSFKRDEYMAHYHRRSNVESTFSMIKRKFGAEVRAKTDTAMVTEALCKILAHNLCVLNQEEQELGIDPTFFAETRVVPALAM
jgi:transposase